MVMMHVVKGHQRNYYNYSTHIGCPITKMESETDSTLKVTNIDASITDELDSASKVQIGWVMDGIYSTSYMAKKLDQPYLSEKVAHSL